MLYIQQSCRNIMMPISQLVVLVSYNFWVQLFHPDLPHQRGFKEKEEKRGKLEGQDYSRKAKDSTSGSTRIHEGKMASLNIKERLSTCRCVLNYKPRQMFNICLIFRMCTLNIISLKEGRNLFLACCIYPQYPLNYPQLPVSDMLIGWRYGIEGRLCLLQIKAI